MWKAIHRTRLALERCRRRAEQVTILFRQHILPRERQLTAIHGEVTGQLMDHFATTRLADAEQILLELWITDKLQTLNAHPFASESQCAGLNQRWRELQASLTFMNHDEAGASPAVARTALDELLDDEELDEEDVIFDFGWHNGSTSPRDQHSDQQRTAQDEAVNAHEPHSESSGRSPHEDHAGFSDGPTDTRVSELERRLSLERLFRQLARVLHPDREQDDARKAEKHILMSQCLKARQDKDIDTLLSLYTEHVGALPDDLTAADRVELIAALELQLRQLQQELQQLRFGDPLQAQIIERYVGPEDTEADPEQVHQRISRHADSLDLEISRQQARLAQLDSCESLLAALDERREVEQDRLAIDRMTGFSWGFR